MTTPNDHSRRSRVPCASLAPAEAAAGQPRAPAPVTWSFHDQFMVISWPFHGHFMFMMVMMM
eukprot:6845310-Lingulodinium_polyedra.AAC.1